MLTREQLLERLNDSDHRMRELVDTLTPEQREVPFHPGINPPIWEMGHAAFFYEFFLLRPVYGFTSIMPGYDEVWDSFEIPHRERWRPGVVPSYQETSAYYDRVLDAVRERLLSERPLSPDEIYLFQYVIAHVCMHLESLIWCRQTLGYPAPSFLGDGAGAPAENRGESGDAEIPGGEYFIGVPAQTREESAANFSFDNERPGFDMSVEAFRISKTLVSNGDFLAFVEDKGYGRSDLWSFGGRHWLRENKAEHPVYWEKRDGEWWVRRFDQWTPLSLEAPVLHVSYREAEAFCEWAGRRLPTEFEWEIAARGTEAIKYPGGADPEAGGAYDLDLGHGGTLPVDALPETASPFGCLQMLGTCWEWTSSQYLPYNGFSVDMYAYMSTLQFGDHKTTRGGSCATSSSLIRSSYRQAYFPFRNDIFIGFRTCDRAD